MYVDQNITLNSNRKKRSRAEENIRLAIVKDAPICKRKVTIFSLLLIVLQNITYKIYSLRKTGSKNLKIKELVIWLKIQFPVLTANN